MSRLVVVGGGAAGMSAASVASRRDPDLEVLLLEKGGFISFSACGMPYWIGDVVSGPSKTLVVRTPEEARERGVDARIRTEVKAVDPDARTVLAHGPGGEERIGYDHLCLAPGVEAITPFDGSDLTGVFSLRHLDDGVQLMTHLELAPPDRACIVGGGFVGLEMAEALTRRGIPTHLVHSHPTLLNGMLDPGLGELVNEQVQKAGVTLHLDQKATGLTGEGHVEAVQLEHGRVEADLVLLAIGVRPRTQLAEQAGCDLGPTGAIQVDEGMRTSVPDIYAAGDCVEVPHRITQEPVLLPLALHANRAGRVAGENIAGGQERFPGVLGTAVTTFESTEIAATGLRLEQALDHGFEAVATTIQSVTKAGYFPGAEKVHARLVVEEGSGRLLGGELLGGPGTGKRIDTVAAALWMGAKAEDLEAMDLAYAPPVSPTWDPVAIAARMAGRQA